MPPSQAALIKEVERISKRAENKTCAECEQRDSCWASIILSPFKGGREMGVFICGRCYKHHSSLGLKYVVVKSLSQATPWTDEEVTIFQKSGNEVVNGIFEAKLPEKDRNTLKEVVTKDRKEEAEARMTFITKKYKDLRYFCERLYKRKVARMAEADAENEEEEDASERARDNRTVLLLGGSLSARNNAASKKQVDDHSKNSARSLSQSSKLSPKSMSTSRTQGVLQRAASRKGLALRKSNSDRDLMGRLNSIALGASPAKDEDKNATRTIDNEKETKTETSSTRTAETEVSDSSEEQDPLPRKSFRKSASLDENGSARSLMEQHRQPSKRRELKKTLSGHDLSSLMGGVRTLSSRNLMQLPAALQVQKTPGGPQDGNPRMRKALSARNLLDDHSDLDRTTGQLKKSLSGRSLTRLTLRKSLSGRNVAVTDGDARPSCLKEQRKSSLRDVRRTRSKREMKEAENEPDNPQSLTRQKPVRSKSLRSLLQVGSADSRQNAVSDLESGSTLNRSQPMRKSPSGRFLLEEPGSDGGAQRPGMRKSLSSRMLRPMNDSLVGNSPSNSTHPRMQRKRSLQNLKLQSSESVDRKNLYDPDAKGLTLLQEDSEMSMKDNAVGAPLTRKGSSRQLSPKKSSISRSGSSRQLSPKRASLSKEGSARQLSPTRSSLSRVRSSRQLSPKRSSLPKVGNSGQLSPKRSSHGDLTNSRKEDREEATHTHEGQPTKRSSSRRGLLDACTPERWKTDTSETNIRTPQRTVSAESTVSRSEHGSQPSLSHDRSSFNASSSSLSSRKYGLSRRDERTKGFSRVSSMRNLTADTLKTDSSCHLSLSSGLDLVSALKEEEESPFRDGWSYERDKYRCSGRGSCHSKRSSSSEKCRSRSRNSRSSRRDDVQDRRDSRDRPSGDRHSDNYLSRSSRGDKYDKRDNSGKRDERSSYRGEYRSRSPRSRSSHRDKHHRTHGSDRSHRKESRSHKHDSARERYDYRSSQRDRRDDRGTDYGRLMNKVDRFIASVGDVHDDDFWIRMVEKWEEGAKAQFW